MARYYIEHYGYIDDDQHSLAHYGVRGMKWRRHRYGSNSNEMPTRGQGASYYGPKNSRKKPNGSGTGNYNYNVGAMATKRNNSNTYEMPTRGQGASYYGPKNSRKKPNGSGTGNYNYNVGAMATKRNNSNTYPGPNGGTITVTETDNSAQRKRRREFMNRIRHDREARRREEMRRKRLGNYFNR